MLHPVSQFVATKIINADQIANNNNIIVNSCQMCTLIPVESPNLKITEVSTISMESGFLCCNWTDLHGEGGRGGEALYYAL